MYRTVPISSPVLRYFRPWYHHMRTICFLRYKNSQKGRQWKRVRHVNTAFTETHQCVQYVKQRVNPKTPRKENTANDTLRNDNLTFILKCKYFMKFSNVNRNIMLGNCVFWYCFSSNRSETDWYLVARNVATFKAPLFFINFLFFHQMIALQKLKNVFYFI